MELIAQFGLFNGILALLLIIAYSFRRSVNKVFLGLSLFFVWYTLLLLYLNATELILQFPALLRTGILAAYLSFPFLYIYSRNTFYPGRFWRTSDWLLLLPALVYLIDLMPFFLLPAEEKIAIWRNNLADNRQMILAREGWLGIAGFHFTFAYIWIAIIMVFQLRLISKNWNVETGFKSNHNRRLLYFILTISLLYIPLLLPGLFGIIFRQPWFNAKFIAFTYGLSLSGIAIYLLIYPNLLNGFMPERKFSFPTAMKLSDSGYRVVHSISEFKISQVNALPAEEPATNEKIDSLSNDTGALTPELAIVLEHMKQEKPFRKQGLTIQDVSNQTGIPVYQLSPLINGYFKMNFVNWVNRYRIEYFIEQATENQHMTLEALSKEAGFISRSTFISAFKKEKGMTPREYLKDLKLTA